MSKWAEELKKMKIALDAKLADTSRKEAECRKKYESDVKKVLDLIRAQCEPVVDAYRDPSLALKREQPRFRMNETAESAWLKVPIPSVTDLTMDFRLVLADIGCSVEVKREYFDTEQETKFITTHTISPPITAEAIQNQIRIFLKERNDVMRRLKEEKLPMMK